MFAIDMSGQSGNIGIKFKPKKTASQGRKSQGTFTGMLSPAVILGLTRRQRVKGLIRNLEVRQNYVNALS